MPLEERLARLRSELPKGVTLVVVSKYQSDEAVQRVYDAGQRDFGENHVQSLVRRAEQYPKDARWHMVGHLQRNKVRQLLPHVWMVHSLDSLRLAEELNRECVKLERRLRCLVQVHIAQEEGKYGFGEEEVRALFREGAFARFERLDVVGLMGMATFTQDEAQVRGEFTRLRALRDWVVAGGFAPSPEFRELSMGMSDDYLLALAEGSTMLRVGRGLFAEP